MRIRQNFRFTNWAGNESCTAAKYFQPENESEIISIIKEAAAERLKVRVAGAGHSWSRVAMTDGYLMNLDLYNHVIRIDKDRCQVHVQAGIRLKELNRVLEENGMSLTNLGSVSEQSIAGAISTGTHGTGISFGCLATQVITMKVILANGEILQLNENDERLNAFRVSVGWLGIITEVTLQCSTVFHLEENAHPVNFDKALDELPQLLKSTDHPKLWWFPHVNVLQVYRYTRTSKPLHTPPAIEKWFNDSFLARFFFKLLLETGRIYPQLIPRINRLIRGLHFKQVHRVDKSYNVFNVPMPPKHRESEYAIPAEHAAQALRELRALIENSGLLINFVVEVRFVKGDNIWLSPAHGRDSCFIGAYQYNEDSWPAYMSVFEKLMKKYNGRPHWGKEFTLAANDFRALYPRYDDFMKLSKDVDPGGMFAD